MNLKELVYVTTVAECGNISKAAELLYVAQPSLSRSIQKVESDLGADLFKRTQEGLKPTIAGECYLRTAYQIMRLYSDLQAEFSKINDMKVGRLVIGTATHLGAFVLPMLLKEFSTEFPNIDIAIVEEVSTRIEEDLLRGKVDVGILHTPVLSEGIAQRVIVEERFLLAVPPDDPLNEHVFFKDGSPEPYLDLELVRDRPLILTHSGQRIREVTNGILKRAGITPMIHYQTRSIQTASRLVRNGMGITLVPHSFSAFFGSDYSPNYYFIDEKYAPTWQLIAAYSQDIPLSRSAEELIRIAISKLPPLYRTPQ